MLSFYETLARACRGEMVARILHYGDSHAAADILTGSLRRKLQLCFGDAGTGFILPGHPWFWRAGVISRTSADWQVGGLKRADLAYGGRFGLAGVSLSAYKPGQWMSVTAAASSFNIYLLKQPRGGSIDVLLDGAERLKSYSLNSTENETHHIAVGAGDDSIHTIELRTSSAGCTTVFGVVAERGRAGVVYDALGINGARASRPLQWDWQVLSENLKRRGPHLIIIAYGSNEAGDADLDIEDYEARFFLLLKRFQEAAPGASLLVISPPDLAMRARKLWQTATCLPALVEAQRRAARRAGAAFFDLFKAMGGAGSIERWATLRQPLAQKDRVHLTPSGYRLVAEWLYAQLMRGYLKAVLKEGGEAKKQ